MTKKKNRAVKKAVKKKKKTAVKSIRPGQPSKFGGEKPTEIKVTVLPDWKEADLIEAERVGAVSSNGTPKIAELYRRMRTLWYATNKKTRDKIESL